MLKIEYPLKKFLMNVLHFYSNLTDLKFSKAKMIYIRIHARINKDLISLVNWGSNIQRR